MHFSTTKGNTYKNRFAVPKREGGVLENEGETVARKWHGEQQGPPCFKRAAGNEEMKRRVKMQRENSAAFSQRQKKVSWSDDEWMAAWEWSHDTKQRRHSLRDNGRRLGWTGCAGVYSSQSDKDMEPLTTCYWQRWERLGRGLSSNRFTRQNFVIVGRWSWTRWGHPGLHGSETNSSASPRCHYPAATNVVTLHVSDRMDMELHWIRSLAWMQQYLRLLGWLTVIPRTLIPWAHVVPYVCLRNHLCTFSTRRCGQCSKTQTSHHSAAYVCHLTVRHKGSWQICSLASYRINQVSTGAQTKRSIVDVPRPKLFGLILCNYPSLNIRNKLISTFRLFLPTKQPIFLHIFSLFETILCKTVTILLVRIQFLVRGSGTDIWWPTTYVPQTLCETLYHFISHPAERSAAWSLRHETFQCDRQTMTAAWSIVSLFLFCLARICPQPHCHWPMRFPIIWFTKDIITVNCGPWSPLFLREMSCL